MKKDCGDKCFLRPENNNYPICLNKALCLYWQAIKHLDNINMMI